MSRISLAEIAVGSVGCLAATFFGFQIYKQRVDQENIQTEPYVRQALGILQGYDVVMERLGSPLKMQHISKNPDDNKVDPLAGNAKLKIPVTGSKGPSAYLYLWATRPPVTMETPKSQVPTWTINKLDIELGPEYRWTFYVHKDQMDGEKLLSKKVDIPEKLLKSSS
ncbi:uncharacterized protein LOC117320944 [Pecten maximus]|uniref:uncharacterized protein LOC117320944 n=2 Tax=Pecten maximus TaxID=6579 RepID=UPI0014581FFD|nr:uncharacterized protein LOC117320944 [Pecten maximus]